MLRLSPMTGSDLDEVIKVERQVFSCPWTKSMYQHELEKEDSCYLAVRFNGSLIGYGGVLIILEEAHVMTMAVREDFRNMGVATRLMLELIESAIAMGARFLTLEVRKSNRPAIGLYWRFGFQIMGERKHYYMDNFENALIMWTEDVTTHEYQRMLVDLRKDCRIG